MNTVHTSLPAEQSHDTVAITSLPAGTASAESMDGFGNIHPLTDMLIRSQKHVKIDSIVYYMIMMMVALVSLTVYFYAGIV